MKKIVGLQVNLPMHSELYEVGKVPCGVTQFGKYRDDLVITEIKFIDMSTENENYHVYEVYANGQLYRRIEKSPVTIEYEVK